PERPHGTIDKPLDRDTRARDRMAVREGGREAITHWQVLERYQGEKPAKMTAKGAKPEAPAASLLLCQLETGRTHQIRVHLASIGHPLLGDEVYGPGFRTKSALLPQEAQEALADLGGQALHAYMLTIEHPLTGKILRFRSELPPELARLHARLAAIRADSSDK